MTEILNLVVGIGSLIATVVLGFLAWDITKSQSRAEQQRTRSDFFELVDAAARARQRQLMDPQVDIDVRALERAAEVRAGLVKHPEFLQRIVEQDMELLESMPGSARAEFVPTLDEMRAVNGRRWIMDPAVKDVHRALWAGVNLEGHGDLKATAEVEVPGLSGLEQHVAEGEER